MKNYLDSLGKSTRFEENLPGPDWLDCFLQRHKELSMRRANLIKRARAAVSREIMEEWFKKYQQVVENVPPQNIWNCDETNLSDNPGKNCTNILIFTSIFLGVDLSQKIIFITQKQLFCVEGLSFF